MRSKFVCAIGAAALAMMAAPAMAQAPAGSYPSGQMSMPGEMTPPAAADNRQTMPPMSWSSAAPMTPSSAASDASTVERSPPWPTIVGPPGSVTTQLVTNGPIADTEENRARYGEPLSRAGRLTQPAGN
jgi:hypothetical protein